jgi:hypothetical protein
MTKVSVIVYGKELQTPITTSYEVSVYGKSYVIVIIQNECVNSVIFDEKSQNEYHTVLFSGKDIQTILRTSDVIVFMGNTDIITFIDNKGNVVSTYKINDCDAKEAFTEIK